MVVVVMFLVLMDILSLLVVGIRAKLNDSVR
jgi:hypothetical protein